MDIPFVDPALSFLAGKVMQSTKISLLPELNCSGIVVSWARTELEVCRCLRGVVAEWCNVLGQSWGGGLQEGAK